MNAKTICRAEVERVAIESIIVGERRRKRMGNIAGLARSIEARGLIHPLVLDDDRVLVAGGRRLAACIKLGWKSVPARRVGSLTPGELRALEIDENAERVDLDSFEASRKRLAEVAEQDAAAEEYRGESPQFPRKGGRGKKGGRREAARKSGVPDATIRDAERHVTLAERFPETFVPGALRRKGSAEAFVPSVSLAEAGAFEGFSSPSDLPRRILMGVMAFRVEIEREDDGRWLAEVAELPGCMAYGATAEEALARAQALALRVLADRREHGEWPSGPVAVTFKADAAA